MFYYISTLLRGNLNPHNGIEGSIFSFFLKRERKLPDVIEKSKTKELEISSLL